MKHEPVPYQEPNGNPLGCYYVTLSPDGWCNNWYQGEPEQHMEPEWRHEFGRLVSDFIRDIPDRGKLDAYARKYGKVLKPGALPTIGVTVQENYMSYDIRITGCNVEFIPYRKEQT